LSTAATAAWICLSSSDEGSAPGTVDVNACKRRNRKDIIFRNAMVDLAPSTRLPKITFKIQNNVHALGVVASEERDESTHVSKYLLSGIERSIE
jgi:hypothetical protein